jgi:large subunit ribosomal protein L3
MSKFILATKLSMSRTFKPDGTVVAVTRLKAEPCTVTQVKTKDKDGYSAVQIGTGTRRKVSKSVEGHLKPTGKIFRTLKEFIVDGEFQVGQTIDLSQFTPGDMVSVVGVSKGKGFQGVVKRHGFHGHPSTHGHKDQLRMPGSIGAGGLQHVRKGMRMGGRMGGDRITVHNLEVVAVEAEKNELTIQGAVPGATRGLVIVTSVK